MTENCKTCILYPRCITGNFSTQSVECTECGRRGMQLIRRNNGKKEDDTIYRFARCFDHKGELQPITCRACYSLRREKMFA